MFGQAGCRQAHQPAHLVVSNSHFKDFHFPGLLPPTFHTSSRRRRDRDSLPLTVTLFLVSAALVSASRSHRGG